MNLSQHQMDQPNSNQQYERDRIMQILYLKVQSIETEEDAKSVVEWFNKINKTN